MSKPATASVAIVDYGLGNLFSVKHACEFVGLEAVITSDWRTVQSAQAVLLPGVGAFGDAMQCLRRLDLAGPLREIAQSGRPLFGICLGLQLLMSESREFGRHAGLDIIPGDVVRFDQPRGRYGPLKVPQVGWAPTFRPTVADSHTDPWQATPMQGQRDGEYMYFVHSYYARPADRTVVLCASRYGDVEYCSAVRTGNVFAFQFHPERSGQAGLQVYREIKSLIDNYSSVIQGQQHAA